MNKEELLISIATLKDVRDEIQLKINSLEEELKKFDGSKEEPPVIVLDVNTESGYYSYLTITKKLNDHTAHNYFSHLRGIKTRLAKYNNFNINVEIYNISDKEALLEIKHQMDNCEKLQKDNKTQHNAFTAAFNNYVTYIFNFYKQGKEELPSEFVFDD